MKILFSAFACRPNSGSEPGIGWHWAVEFAKLGHDVWVLTQPHHQQAIEAEMDSYSHLDLHFLYYRLPVWLGWWRKAQRGIHVYYILWQFGAYRFAKNVHKNLHFDLVHHITFGVVRHPSFMGRLGIPFVFGPLGGGEQAPWQLRKGCGWRGWILDALRDGMNFCVRYDPLMHQTFQRATQILVTSKQTKNLIPKVFWSKIQVQLAIGIEPVSIDIRKSPRKEQQPFSLLYVGRFLFWKGLHLGFLALAELRKCIPEVRLTIVGQGPDEVRWRQEVKKLGISDNVVWISWVERNQLTTLYQNHDVFLYPSLHDSGGMVVLEALAHGLPVVCLDLGGPGTIVHEDCGRVISTKERNEREVIQNLSSALLEIALNRKLACRLSSRAIEHGKQYYWTEVVIRTYRKLFRFYK